MKYVRSSYKKIFLPVTVPLVVVQLGSMTIQNRLFPTGFEALDFGKLWVPWMLSSLGVFFVWYVAYTALYVAATDAAEGKEIRLRRALLFPLRPAVFGTSLLALLLFGFSALFFFFPAIWVGLILAFTLPVMASENRFGREAMRRSFRLAMYNPEKRFLNNPQVKIFCIYVISVVISWGVTMLIQMPMQIALFGGMMQGAVEGSQPSMVVSPWISFPTVILSTLTTVAVQLYTFFALALLFHDVRRRRDALDLEAAIDEITAQIA